MANALLTLADLTKRRGSDLAVGLIEETTTVAPEVDVIMGRPISGITYNASSRTLPTVTFRNVNDGSDSVKSVYDQKPSSCFFLDAQLQIDEAYVMAEAQNGVNVAVNDILMSESQGALRGAGITIGSQFYYGTNADAKGFNGIASLMTVSNATATGAPVILAGGTTASVQTSVYLVWNNLQGVHFIFGNNEGIQMAPWSTQIVTTGPANSKNQRAYVSNLRAWVGLSVNHTKSIGRIANCEDASSKRLTDALGAKLLQYIPLQLQNSGGLRWMMNQQAAYQLQVSRTASTSITSESPLAFPPTPTQMCGIPITITNSITNTESVLS